MSLKPAYAETGVAATGSTGLRYPSRRWSTKTPGWPMP